MSEANVNRNVSHELLLFDDTYPHGVTHLREGDRIVLLLDIERPIRAPLRWVNRGVLWAGRRSRFVQEVRGRARRWAWGR